MSNKLLHQWTPADGLPIVTRWSVPNAAARSALSLLSVPAVDIGGVCFQQDTKSFWIITNLAPITWASLMGSGASSVDIPYTTAVPFTQPSQYMPPQTIASAVTFTPDTAGAVRGASVFMRLVGDGSHVPLFGSGFTRGGDSQDFNPTAGVINRVEFQYDGVDYRYVIKQDLNELAVLEQWLADNLFCWFRADYRTEVAGKVTLFGDKCNLVGGNARAVDTAHALAQVNAALQVPAVVAQAAFNGKEAAVFVDNVYASTIDKSNFRFLHNGVAPGMRAVTLFELPSDPELALMFGTRSGPGAGFNDLLQAGNVTAYWSNAAGTVIGQGDGAYILNQPFYVDSSYSAGDSPQFSHFVNSTLKASGAISAPSAGDPDATLTLGRSPSGTYPANMLWADSLIAKTSDIATQAKIRRYIFLRYAR
jgi:hypothetical protein